MIGINRVCLLGRAAADPEIISTKSGKTLVKITVAIPGAKKNGSSTVEYFTVTAWDELADTCAKFVRRGLPLYVEGRLANRSDLGKLSLEINAQRIVFLGNALQNVAEESTQCEAKQG